MLPAGFKKDSRVWLHKNAHLQKQKALTKDCYNARLSDEVYDNMSEDPFLNPSPYITDERGLVFKKDSRTWLHKSSIKALSKSIINGVFRVSSTAGKNSCKRRQFKGHARFTGGELGTDLIGTLSGTEITQSVESKMKKSTMVGGLTRDGSFGHTLDSAKELTTNAERSSRGDTMSFPHWVTPTIVTPLHVGAVVINALKGAVLKIPGASYHSMKTAKPGSCEVSAYASDFCIVGKRKPSLAVSSSSSSSVHDDDKSADFGHRSDTCSQFEMESQASNSRPDEGVCADGLGSTVEVTRDGLRELERMMKEQSRHRAQRLGLRRTDDSLYGLPHDDSPDAVSSGSKVSLEACINLSEELGTENIQVQSPVDPLSQPMDCLHLCPPKVPTCTDDTLLSGDSYEVSGFGQ